MLAPPPRPKFRLKADGRIVSLGVDGSEQPTMPPDPATANRESDPASYARKIRAATRLTQAEFAARIGVPIETVRNWEQGKRCPRGPARALLRMLDKAPQVAFAVLSNG